MWKTASIDNTIFDNIEVNERGQFRFCNTKEPIHTFISNPGRYVEISIQGVQYKVHRIVASTFIGSTTGKTVHHIDENRQNPYYKNLKILTAAEHNRIHHKVTANDIPVIKLPEDKYEFILKESDVHTICKLMENGISFPKIREIIGIRRLTDDMLSKIKTGKNWTHISKHYNIPHEYRATMNSFSSIKLELAIFHHRGYTVSEISKIFKISISTKTEYDRLYKCIVRYHDKYVNLQYGLVSREFADKIIDKYLK